MLSQFYITITYTKGIFFTGQAFYFVFRIKQDPFRFTINIDSFCAGAQPYESKYFLLMYATQCVPFIGSELTIFISDSNEPSL